MDRATISTLWDGALTHGLGFAPWKDVLVGLSPEHAAWRPGNERHSIWAHVSHICFWREYIAAAARKHAVPNDEEIKRLHFAAPVSGLEIVPAAWHQLQHRFLATHALMAEVYRDPSAESDWMWGLVAHDSYHVGQIMLLRALQGLRPLM